MNRHDRINITGFLLILLIFSCIITPGCSSDNENNEPSNNNESYDFGKTVKVIDDMIETGEINDKNSLISKVSKMSGYSGYEKKGNAIYLNFNNGNQYYVNFSDSGSKALFSTDNATANLDSYIDQIESSLGYDSPDDTKTKTRKPTCISLPSAEETSVGASRIGEPSAKPKIINNRKVLFWSPLLTDKDSDYNNFIKSIAKVGKRLNTEIEVTSVLRNNQPTISSILDKMTEFGKYSVVIIACHGAEKGEMMIPRDNSVNSKGLTPGYGLNFKNNKLEKCYLLSGDYILNLLPHNLNRTIIWACMCYASAENSNIRAAFTSRNVADFWGPTNSIAGNISISQFGIFFSGFQAGFPSRKESSVKIPYTFMDEGETISGNLINLSDGITLCFVRTKPMPNPNKAHGRIVFPQRIISKKATQSSRFETEGRFFGFSLLCSKGYTNDYYLADIKQYATYINISNNPEVINLDYSVSLEWLEEGKYIFRTFVDTDDGRIYSAENYTLNIHKNYTETYSGTLPHYHYYKYLLDDGTYNTIYEGTDECEARATISWKNGTPSVSLEVYTTMCNDFDNSGDRKKATSVGQPLIFDKYSFQRERNIIRITTDLYQTFKDETSYNDTNISLKAEFDLGKGTLYIDHIETWKGTNKYGNVRALYHPQGTIKRASSSY